jgi:DNA topoisomerase I
MPRLRRSDSAGPGIHRVKAGRGFSYRAADGERVHDPELLDRIAALAIPPAWTDVWIAPYANGHIQATGLDAAGRRQYLYHPQWRAQKDRVKFDRALALAESLPAARRSVTRDLRRDGLPRERVLAAAFRMLDSVRLRVGSERYAEQHGSFGLSTLLCAHAGVNGDEVVLDFPAKSGQEWRSEIRDADLAAVVTALKRRGGRARLLAWRDESGWHPLTAAEINADVRRRTGGDFTAKDFRTLHGTIAAALSLARTGRPNSKSGKTRAVAAAMREAAEALGNTPAIARASYVDPRVIDRYQRGETIDASRPGSAESQLRALLFS